MMHLRRFQLRTFGAACVVALAALALSCGGPKPAADSNLRAVRIACWKRGVYRITGADLQKLGIDLATVCTRDIALVHMSDSVPVLLENAGRRLTPQTEMIFYSVGGKAAPIPYVNMEERYYPATQDFMLYLDPGPWAPRRFETVPVKTPAEADLRRWPTLTVNGRWHYEDDPIWDFFKIIPGDRPIDFVFWKKLSFPATTESPSSAELDFALPKIETGDEMEMELFLVARTEIGDVAHNVTAHRIAIDVNGLYQEKAQWSGERGRIKIKIPPNVLRENINHLTVRILEPFIDSSFQNTLMNVDVAFLDWFEVRFRQRTQLEGDYNEFLIGAGEDASTTATRSAGPVKAEPLHFSIRQFTDAGVLTLDIDRGLKLEAPPYVQGRGSPFMAVNLDLPNRPTRLVALTHKSLQKPLDMRAVEIKNLFRKPNEAEMLILAPPQFIAPLERLAQWKRLRGLSVSIIDIKDLFNERTSGYASPMPIRDYIRHVYQSQQPSPRLRYVLLVGDSSSISKEPTQLPAYSYVQGGRHANDNYFVALKRPQDNPFVAVGRIPVQDGKQLANVADKIIRYEKGEGWGAWRARFLLIAASHQWARDDCDKMISGYLNPFEVRYLKTDISRRDLAYHAELNRTLSGYFNEGNLITAFFGHGGGGVWEVGPTSMDQGFQRHLFDQSAVEALANGPRLPLVFALTCYTNDFDSPFHPQTLGETFVDAPGGAIAVIGANDRSYIEFNSQYIDKFMDLLFKRRPRTRLGDLFLETKLALNQPIANEHYQLLGDPSLEFSLPGNRLNISEARVDGARLHFKYLLDQPQSAGPWQLDGYILDSKDRLVVHWHEAQALRSGEVVRALNREEQTSATRLVLYFNKPGSGDQVGAAALTSGSLAAVAPAKNTEAGRP
ncbi:C25 family cysteine peptidase [bacterium]|nr:C25 family cysteine peptidase [bacterium]